MSRILFIHRSVGENIIVEGRLYDLLDDSIDFSDFNQNTSILRNKSKSNNSEFQMPGNNTHPENYAVLFSNKTTEMLNFVMNFDIIIIKSCYPNSNIKSTFELEKIKNYYNSIFSFFSNYPEKNLIAITSPPLQPIMTKLSSAKRAKELTNWLVSLNLNSNIKIFDLFDLLADKSGRLKRQYRRFLPFDSHPNKKANVKIAKELASTMINVQSVAS